MKKVLSAVLLLSSLAWGSSQGCPNEGADHRAFGKVTCALQRIGSFHSKVPPFLFALDFPLGMRVYLPWRKHKEFMFRAAVLRYDYNAQQYIFFSAAAKRVDRPEF